MSKPDQYNTQRSSTEGKDSKQKFFTTYTYGCQMNQHDSERLAGQLKSIGYEYTEELTEASFILINTCCVRESAEKKIYGKIGELKNLKISNPSLIIAIAGCMAQKDREKLFKKAPHIDIIIGTHNVHQLVDLVKEVEDSKKHVLAVWDQAEQLAPDVPTIRREQFLLGCLLCMVAITFVLIVLSLMCVGVSGAVLCRILYKKSINWDWKDLKKSHYWGKM